MLTRRDFISEISTEMGAALIMGVGLNSSFANTSTSNNPIPKKDELISNLHGSGKQTHQLTFSDGSTILILPHGGRVLGLYSLNSYENFYWTNPALSSKETAQAFYSSDEWQNSGGDRTWLAPELDLFFPKYPDTKTYWQPRELDPGNYEVTSSGTDLKLTNTLSLKFSRSGKSAKLRMSKSFGPALSPLRYTKTDTPPSLSYAGYTQFTRLEILEGPDCPYIGLWNLVQMPHQGDLLIPTFGKASPKIWFGDIAADDLLVSDYLVRYKMRAKGEHKLGISAVSTTGRVGYIFQTDNIYNLIIRSFTVNPSGEYVDVAWNDPGDLGYSTQACNINSKLGEFSELEYHIPAIGGNSGLICCDDVTQVWAYRGNKESISQATRLLLGCDI